MFIFLERLEISFSSVLWAPSSSSDASFLVKIVNEHEMKWSGFKAQSRLIEVFVLSI